MSNKIALAGVKGNIPLYQITYRMPSPNRANLSKEEKEIYEEAYRRAWKKISRLGFKTTTSNILSRKPKSIIEKAIAEAIDEFKKRGINIEEFEPVLKTTIDSEEEDMWIRNALLIFKKEIKAIEEKINKLGKMEPEERIKKQREAKRKIDRLKRQVEEVSGLVEIEEVLKRI